LRLVFYTGVDKTAPGGGATSTAQLTLIGIGYDFTNASKDWVETPIYPANVSIDIGANRLFDYNNTLTGTYMTGNLNLTLNNAIANGSCSCSGCVLTSTDCYIPFTFKSSNG
jgi:hypothetical protein